MNVQSMWIGDKLGGMQVACIKSFLKNGYKYHLYVYDRILDIPKGTTVLDGNEILSKDRAFKYSGSLEEGGGSYSGFSNFFRFKLLMDRGGTWVDTDVYCLKRLPETEYIFVKEWTHLASCILRCPKGCEFARTGWEFCNSKDVKTLKWGETGPILVTKIVSDLKLEKFIQDENLYFPIKSWEVEAYFKNKIIPKNAYTLHFWNEVWRKKGFDKESKFSDSCLYEKLLSNFPSPTLL